MYADSAPIASLTDRNEFSLWFSRVAIMPFPSVATFRRTQSIVSCASSQFIANNKMAFESAPTGAPQETLLNSDPSLRQNLQNRMAWRSCRIREERDSYLVLKETHNEILVPEIPTGPNGLKQFPRPNLCSDYKR